MANEKSRPSSDGAISEKTNVEETGEIFTSASEARVHELARQLSHVSHHDTGVLSRITTSHTLVDANPFDIDSEAHPELDPSSPSFNPRQWVKTLMRHQMNDSGHVVNNVLKAGVSFRNLSVHGFGTPTDFQKDVFNIFLTIPEGIRSLLTGSNGRKTKIQILRDFEGVVRSGEMLVVLGRPGSGCSTFLKTIAGETHGFYVDGGSVVNYQGIPGDAMHENFRGEVIYQAENDVHFPQLTVGETLQFAAEARCPRLRPFNVSRRQYAEHLRDVIMAVFGISHTVNTKVGNDFIRGVSGGERKRVSIAEVALSGSPLQCWDNSTRGLDAATALEFVKTLRMSSDLMGSTALLAIYQAPQATYELFNKVIVLYAGRQIYFGPTSEARKYFTDIGYVCPPRSTTADFLTSITNPSERIVSPGFENRVPRTPEEFAQAWKASENRKRLLEEIETFETEFPLEGNRVQEFREARALQQAKGTSSKSPYTLSIPMQVGLCMRRGFKRLKGDASITLTGIVSNFILALVIGSVFYMLPADSNSFYSRGALLFFAVLLNAFASALEILTLYSQRPIVEKHSKYALYRPFTEAISSMLCDLPAKLITSVSFNLPLYFMTNLRKEADAFFIFLLFTFFCTLTMSNMFRTIASVSKTIHQAMPPAAIFILGLIIYTGFTIPIRDMRVYARWINYVNPIAYIFESLMVNEFSGRKFPCVQYIPANLGGTMPQYDVNSTTLPESYVCGPAGSVPGQAFVDGDLYIETAYQYSKSHMWRNLGIEIAFMLFFLFTHLWTTEYISMSKSKGEVLVFPHKRIPRTSAAPHDLEGTNEKRAVTNDTPSVGSSDVSARIQKQTAIFHWADVCYDIKIKKEDRRILDHVDGWVKPGTLTALMGVSGAGKTTLLDVLANRVTMGVVTGSMFVDGQPRNDSFQRKTGYVQQQDVHLATSTVREALRFSATLRQPASVSMKEKIDYVEEIIDLLEMTDYADAVIGVPGEGLNVEQRKRLTIAVELAAKPELLLFLDEPTSGLDSQTAWSICKLMRKLANNGQAILCTIHQPSAILLQEFDRLLFLAKGGKTVYFGDIGKNSEVLTGYFERNGASPCPVDANPAEWILEVIGAAPGAVTDKDWFKIWTESPEKIAVKEELTRMEAELSLKPRTDSVIGSSSEFAVPFSQQLYAVTLRVFQQYWRTPTYIYSKSFMCVGAALFIGFSFYMAPTSLQGLQNQMFAIFMLLILFGDLAQQLMPHFVTQRSLYEVRERPSKVYSWKAFMMANIFVEIPWQTLMAILTFIAWYYPIGLYRNTLPTDSLHERSGLMFLFIWAFFVWTSTFSHMVIAGLEDAETAANLAQLLFSLCLTFCGILAGPDVFPRFWIFLYRLSPFTYLVGGMMSTGLANTNVVCSDIELRTLQPPNGLTCGAYLEDYQLAAGGRVYNPDATRDCRFCAIEDTNMFLKGIHTSYDTRWRDFGLLLVYIAFNIVGAVVLYWVARVPKRKGEKKKME